MKIRYFQYQHGADQYGGNIYDGMVADVLSLKHDFKLVPIVPGFTYTAKWPQQLFLTRRAERLFTPDLWIRDMLAVASMSRHAKKSLNVAIVHHVAIADPTIKRFLSQPILSLFLRNVRNCDRVVAVSEYWKAFLEKQGVGPVDLIHNAFDIEKFCFSESDVDSFKRRHGLGRKPIIYVGNPQREKGAAQVCEALGGMDVQLVTSGIQNIQLPARVFRLSYSDYRLLLAASDVVVAMSTFPEGWNRTAHEAMLCRTPVVGSGTGGMGELLAGGNQIVCEDLVKLPSCVASALQNSVALGQSGFEFASQFTRERFASKWQSLIARLSPLEQQ